MYIGGTSGSTAGGLKTTTLGILFYSRCGRCSKGKTRAEAFGRTIRQAAVLRALTLFFVTLTLCVVAIMILSVTETIPSTSGIEYIAFEVFFSFRYGRADNGSDTRLISCWQTGHHFIDVYRTCWGHDCHFSLLVKANKAEPNYKLPEESVMIG